MDDQQEAEALHQQKDERTPQQELPGQVNAGVLHQAQLAEANGEGICRREEVKAPVLSLQDVTGGMGQR